MSLIYDRTGNLVQARGGLKVQIPILKGFKDEHHHFQGDMFRIVKVLDSQTVRVVADVESNTETFGDIPDIDVLGVYCYCEATSDVNIAL